MRKKELEEKIIELEDLVNDQKRLIDSLNMQLDDKLITNESCPNGGTHNYIILDSGGWKCNCGKSQNTYRWVNTITG